MPVDAGQIVAGKYRLVRRLARGGMGAVWRARHIQLDVDVALKFQRADAELGKGAEERFRREARAAAQLKSPHVVHIYDYGIHEDSGYIAMELLEGQDLGERLASERKLSPETAVEIVLQAIRGIRAAHERGLIHRDIKPGNLFLTHDSGELLVKILDFGIVKDQQETSSETTQSGLVFGSPSYMSPEQARGGRIDERTDLWSLGAVLYRMLTGRLPFEGANQNDIVVKLCTLDVPAPSTISPELDPCWDNLFRRVMARDVAQRFDDLDAFREELERLMGRQPGVPSRKSRAAFESGAGRQKEGRDTETAPLSLPSDPDRRAASERTTVDGATTPLASPSSAEEDRRSEPRTAGTLTSNLPASEHPRRRFRFMPYLLGGATAVALALVSLANREGDAEQSASGRQVTATSDWNSEAARHFSEHEEKPSRSEPSESDRRSQRPSEGADTPPPSGPLPSALSPTDPRPANLRHTQGGREGSGGRGESRSSSSQTKATRVQRKATPVSQESEAPVRTPTDPVFGLPLGSP